MGNDTDIKILLIGMSQELEELIILDFIKNGIEVYTSKTIDKAYQLMNESGITHIIIDILNRNEEWMSFLEKLRVEKKDITLYTIIYSTKPQPEIVRDLLKLGMMAFVLNRSYPDEARQKLLKLIQFSKFVPNKRRYLRVKPDDGESTSINFPLTLEDQTGQDSDVLVKCKIVDISIETIAFVTNSELALSKIPHGKLISNAQLNLDKRIANVTIKVVKRENLVIGYYISPDDKALNLVSQYIFKKMQEHKLID